jgi:Smg protein
MVWDPSLQARDRNGDRRRCLTGGAPVELRGMRESSMNESMVDVLIYLYENYMDGDGHPPIDQDDLEEELSQAGFSSDDIRKALNWLDELVAEAEVPHYHPHHLGSMRVYSRDECARLDLAARGLLLFLEQNGILDSVSRELVIDRVLAIDHANVTVDEVKWIVLLVLLNRPGQEAAFSQMEDMVYNEAPAQLH